MKFGSCFTIVFLLSAASSAQTIDVDITPAHETNRFIPNQTISNQALDGRERFGAPTVDCRGPSAISAGRHHSHRVGRPVRNGSSTPVLDRNRRAHALPDARRMEDVSVWRIAGCKWWKAD